jgi:cation-transporting ATPase 13A2
LKISCFDKTGTLTENNILLDRIFLYDKELKNSELVNKNSEIYNLMTMLFGTCHTVRKYENEFLGDEVDLRMFEHSKFAKTRKSEKDVYEDHLKKLSYEVVKVHQFESKFQSMSVLVHDTNTSKFYCFSKGAPEKMMSVSINKIPNYEDFVAKLALKGLRTIAFSFKEIPVSEVSLYRTCPRESFLENTRLIGLVTFENELKPDTPDTIRSLREAGINCKMITGDGIFIAV